MGIRRCKPIGNGNDERDTLVIDFVSTREGTEPQTAACAQLLSAVIAQAIRDACIKPTEKEQKAKRNIDTEASDAIRFLFGKNSVFQAYAQLIGADAEQIRNALLNRAEDTISATKKQFGDQERRILRARVEWMNATVA